MRGKRIFNCNFTKFQNIDSEDKAYWLGFLAGDGSVNDYSLRLELSNKDFNHIKKFNDFMESDYNIKSTPKDCSQVCINSKILVDSLSKYYIVPNKVYKVLTPNIQKNLLKHYYRGILDSDGWIIRHKLKNKKDQFEFGFSSANQDFIIEIKNWICANINKDCGYICHRKYKVSKGEVYQLIFGGRNNFKLISNLLYDGFHCSTYLERKYQKVLEFSKEIENSIDLRCNNGKYIRKI